jgi:hypothetical protein
MCTCNNNTPYNPCNACNQTPCNPPQDCDCPVKDLSTDCVLYDGDTLPCTEINGNQPLTNILQQLDNYFCVLRQEFLNLLTFVNIGLGARIFKGVDLLGRKQFRKINKGTSTLTTVTENADDISIEIDEEVLSDFVKDNQKTYTVANVGTGVQAYKDSTIVGNNTQYNFRTVTKQDLGDGVSFLRDIQQNTNELNVRVKTLISDNLTITSTDDEVRIETPMTASIPALYVNNLYVPSYPEWLAENKVQNGGTAVTGFVFRGKGSLAQPFTDSTVYPLLGGSATITTNTAIQNALDGDSSYAIPYSYVGTGTRLSPQRQGQIIIIQNNNFLYTHAGDYNYNNIKINLQATVVNTTNDYIIDMDNPLYFDATSSTFEITINENYSFQCTNSLGFRNSGNNSSTPPAFDTGRIGIFLGEGSVYFSYNGADILTRYIFNGEGNNNDNNLHFVVKCRVIADRQGIYLTKNKMAVDFYNQLQSGILGGSGDISLKAFHMTGGQVRFYEKGAVYLANENTGRTYGFTFEPTGLGIGSTSFQLNSARVAGNSEKCFTKLNNEYVSFLAFNSPSGDGFATVLAGTNVITNGLFENLGATRWNVSFKNNVFSYTGIDQTKVDLTQGNNTSTINFIGNSVLENLVVYNNKADAIVAGVALYSAFLKRKIVNAPDLVVGVEYKVLTSGVPSLGAVGSFFTATGSETGTGTAVLETREILN